jgi:hypothetical protein
MSKKKNKTEGEILPEKNNFVLKKLVDKKNKKVFPLTKESKAQKKRIENLLQQIKDNNIVFNAQDYKDEQIEKDFITLYPDLLKDIRKTLEQSLKLIDEKRKKGKFKRSGHLTDQILKYTLPEVKEKKQLSIWDLLEETTKTDLEVANIERSEVVEGIKLSGTETKLIDSLCKLLHDKSEVYDKKAPNYYTGTEEIQIVNYSNDKTPLPKIAVTLYELTQVYKGDDKYISGKDIENVKEVLTELSEKKFLVKYTETSKDKKGNTTIKEIEGYRSIIFLDKATITKVEENYRRQETIISLSPIFRRQIDSKFILYPHDINKRTAIAYGGEKVSGASLKLRDYLMREHANKHYSPEISQYNLSYLLAENLMKASRKSDVEKAINKALITCKNLGLLESHTITENKTGEPKYIFKLKKDWE